MVAHTRTPPLHAVAMLFHFMTVMKMMMLNMLAHSLFVPFSLP